MRTLTADDVLAALDEIADQLPLLEIFTTKGLGRSWAVDPDRHEIWINGALSIQSHGMAVMDALRELCHYHDIPFPRPALRLVHSLPQQRDRHQDTTTTGTDGR